LSWSEVANIDLSTFNSPGGKEALAKQLIEAVRTKGFFYVTGYGIPQEEVDRQFALGQAFYELPLEEKLK
jgi:isopenicillin N synthase-like dioxygenase